MSEQMYSADEAAQLLGLQVRTVRNYVRDGLLPGVRIGKQYRIARADLEAFTGGMARGGPEGETRRTREPDAAAGQLTARATVSAEVSSVIQVERVSAEEVERLERTLLAFRGAATVEPASPLRIEPLYDEQRRRLKLVVVGSLAETGEILRIVDALTRSV